MTPFKRYWDDLSDVEQQRLADKLDTSVPYLYQISTGFRKPGHKFAKRLEKETGIPREKLRPDIFGELRA